MTTVPHTPHPLATLAQIVTSPSKRDGLPGDLENDLRVGGCMLIQEAGIMLELYVAGMVIRVILMPARRAPWRQLRCCFTVSSTSHPCSLSA